MPEKPKTEEKKEKKETDDGPHINWLVVDRTLRPDGFHLQQEPAGNGTK